MFIKLLLVFSVLESVTPFIIPKVTKAPKIPFAILHTGDVRSRFDMITSAGRECSNPSRCYGGLPRRAAYIENMRRNHKNVLLFDSGDQLPGSMWYFHHKGKVEKYFLHRLDYTAIALGPNEFGLGEKKLVAYLQDFTIPVLCANLVTSSKVHPTILEKVFPSLVLNVEGVRVGVIGYVDQAVQHRFKTWPLIFTDAKESILSEVTSLQSRGIDLIIVLGHEGFKKNFLMFNETDGVDIVLSGGSGKVNHNSQTQNVVFGSSDLIKKPVVMHTGSYGMYIGHLICQFTSVLDIQLGSTVLLDRKFEENKVIKKKLNDFYKPLMQFYDVGVGKSEFLDSWNSKCFTGICAPGQVLVTALLNYSRMKEDWAADLALAHGSLFDDNIYEGEVTYGDVAKMLPFETKIVKVGYEGFLLKKVFDLMVASMINKTENFLNFAGMEVTYDDSTYQITNVQVWDEKKYIPFEESKTYNVILPLPLTQGIMGYELLHTLSSQIVDLGVIDLDVMLAYLDIYHVFKVDPTKTLVMKRNSKKLQVSKKTQKWMSIFISCFIFITTLCTLIMLLRSQPSKYPAKFK